MEKFKDSVQKWGFLKQLTFWPAMKLLMREGFQQPLVESDLPHLLEVYGEETSMYFLQSAESSSRSSDIYVPSQLKHWINRITRSSPTMTCLKPLLPRLAMATLFRIVPDAIGFIVPFVLRQIILSVQGQGEVWEGCAFALLLLVLLSAQMLMQIQSHLHVLLCAMSARGILNAKLYSKMLRLSSKQSENSGAIVNLLNVDTEATVELIPSFYVTWVAPLQLGISVYLLWRVLGWSIVSGIVVMSLIMAANILIAPKVRQNGAKLLKLKDKIVTQVGEIISGIKIIKLQAWEEAFEKLLLLLRREQVEILRRITLLVSVSAFLESCAPYFVTFATLGTLMILKTEDLFDAETCFVSMILFGKMFEPMAWFPLGVTRIFQTMPSIKRIDDYLRQQESTITKKGSAMESHSSLEVEVDLALANNLSVAIIGAVGSGKSTALKKILDTNTNRGRIGYMSQEPWIQSGTIRENIIFDGVYDARKFQQAISLAELEHDLGCLPNAEYTAVGERGMSVSGGQKQRISLGRVIYADADWLLLDDPISAVDAAVGKRIFSNVIGPHGLYKNKTRFVATSDLSFLDQFDRVLLLDRGVISYAGTYDEVRGSGIVFDAINTSSKLKTWTNGKITKEDDNPVTVVGGVVTNPFSSRRKEFPSIRSEMRGEIATGTSWSLYADFCNAAGFHYVFGTLIGLTLFQAFSMHASAYLAEWSTLITTSRLDETRNGGGARSSTDSFDFLGNYALLGVLQAVSILAASVCLNSGVISATTSYCSKLYQKLLQTPLHTYEANFTGGVMNVFAKDLNIMDSSLRMNIKWWLTPAFQTAATVILVIYSLPLLLILGTPVALAFLAIQKYHSTTTRQIKQMEASVRSAIISMVSESLQGLDTINAFRAGEKFNDVFRFHLERLQNIEFAVAVTLKWLKLSLEMLPICVVFVVSFLFVIKRDESGAVLAGLAISSIIQLTFSLRTCIKYACEVDINMMSVERIKKYLQAEEEARTDPQTNLQLPPDWPAKGEVKFVNLSASHFGNRENVLKNIDLRIHSGEKIGIVGRTGAGKSSLGLSLYRLLNFDKGHIEIDGFNISSISTKELRKRISIVPQEPTLFSGTIRSNLDFLGEHSDVEIWRVLNVLNLRTLVNRLPNKLEHVIVSSGGNFSLGERQLLCLGRALLRRSKILILDEATSAVDAGTQEIIARTCRSELRRATVLIIAHRHDIIQDCHRIITVCDGQIQNIRDD